MEQGTKAEKYPGSKKQKKWKNFSKRFVEDGMELGQKGLDMFNKQKDRQSPMGQVKTAVGARNKSGKISRIKKKLTSGRISAKKLLNMD